MIVRNLSFPTPVSASMTHRASCRISTRRLTVIAVASVLLAPASAQAAPTLSGVSVLHVQQQVAYRAKGLAPAGSYSLRIRRRAEYNGRAYRYVAYLSAPRRSSGTERFLGSVPTGLQCRRVRGDGPVWQPDTLTGRYQAVVCVAATHDYLCNPHYSVATKRVRVTRGQAGPH